MRYIIDSRGRRTHVVLSLKAYNQLMEDLHDVGAMADARTEPRISWEELKPQLIRDGVISEEDIEPSEGPA